MSRLNSSHNTLNEKEYCVQAWPPYLVKNIELMEKVQKRMTRMLPDL